jgi:hypothetical protein
MDTISTVTIKVFRVFGVKGSKNRDVVVAHRRKQVKVVAGCQEVSFDGRSKNVHHHDDGLLKLLLHPLKKDRNVTSTDNNSNNVT